jgi:hypothetical protein
MMVGTVAAPHRRPKRLPHAAASTWAADGSHRTLADRPQRSGVSDGFFGSAIDGAPLARLRAHTAPCDHTRTARASDALDLRNDRNQYLIMLAQCPRMVG